MAAPVRNLTDPTGLSRLAPVFVVPLVPIPAFLATKAMPLYRRPPLTQFNAMPKAPGVPVVRIPEPPLGRLIFNTFPAIYKDKPKPLVRTGQIFPRGNR